MVSLRESVVALYKENNEISVSDLKESFADAKEKTLADYLSMARLSRTAGFEPKTFSKIDEEEVEKIIIAKLNKSLDNSNIRLAIDFLKIKRSGSELEDKLDIEKYIKKVRDAKP